MKAITLYEPYASLMMIGAKQNETRPMRTLHRGDICIHAAKSRIYKLSDVKGAADAMNRIDGFLSFNWGCIVAVVDLWAVESSDNFFKESIFSKEQKKHLIGGGMIQLSDEEINFGNYSPFRWIYRTRNLRRLKTPIPAKGFQCVGWTLPPDIEAKVRAQI